MNSENNSQATQRTDNNGLPISHAIDNWTPREIPPKTEMQGDYCKLEPFDVESHYVGLYDSFSKDIDARNWTYLPYGPFSTADEFKQWCDTECTASDPLFHTIFDLHSGKITGMASYLRITPDAGTIEVGHIHFSPLMQGTRLATESMYLMMRRVFDELGYRRYEWKCDALNTPSCRAAKRLGFQFEGIFRQATIYKQRNRDTAWFAIIDSDWPRLRNGFKTWLSKENFDNQGQQIQSLQQCFGQN